MSTFADPSIHFTRPCIFGLLLSASLLNPSSKASAKSKSESRVPVKIGVGLAAGATSGYGPNLRLDLGSKWGLSATLLPFPRSTRLGTSAALQGIRILLSRGSVRGYALLGAHYRSFQDRLQVPVDELTVKKEFEVAALGTGLGLDLNAGPLRFAFELPLTFVFALSDPTALAYPGDFNFTLYPNLAFCLFPAQFKR